MPTANCRPAELAARPAPAFDRIDANGDGAVTEEEIATARAEMATAGAIGAIAAVTAGSAITEP